MKTIISILALTLLTQFSFAQDMQKEDVIKKAANEMAWGLYSPSSSQQLLANQAERQIKEQIGSDSSATDEEIIEDMILETQQENIEHAKIVNESIKRLNFCEEASGVDTTETGIYVSRYTEGKVDKIQEGLAGKTKQYTAEVYVQGNLLGSLVEYSLKASNCMEKLKADLREGKECSEAQKKKDIGTYNTSNVGSSLGKSSTAIGW